MRDQTPGYPVLVREIKTGKEVAFFINMEGLGGWDVYIYKFDGYVFTRIAKGFTAEKVVQLVKLLNPRIYESGQYLL